MGITKTSLYTEEQNQLASIIKAIGHPARIAILQHLIKTEECINSDLVLEIGLAQATISQHLKALKEVDIIQGSVEGTSMCYCINPNTWNLLKNKINAFFEPLPNCCETC